MRTIGLLVLAVALVVGSAGAASAAETKTKTTKSAAKAENPATRSAEAAKKFETFCGGWLDKLRERERFNRTRIEWRKEPSGVVGEYVGYDTKTYRMHPPADVQASPVGKLVYMELRLRITGESEAAALKNGPQIIEQTEVTELFRYDRGAWVY
jgi:hypothetical protein